MADMIIVVDAAVKVPVNILPLLDDGDFKTIEDAVAYDAAGMDLRWNFLTTAGVQTSTAVTPTTSGDYDWTHKGDGIYEIEIPASAGASINNDTEGFGWFSGKVTGVLPWRGPIIQFSPANVVNALVNGTDLLQVDVAQYGNSNGTFSGGRPEVNMSHIAGAAVNTASAQLGVNVVQIGASTTPVTNIGTVFNTDFAANYDTTLDVWRSNIKAISDDTVAADNAEKFFDGTGYGPLAARLTVGTVTNQTTFLVVGGGATDGQFVGETFIIRDPSEPSAYVSGRITGYDGSTGEVTFDPNGTPAHTIAENDLIDVVPGLGTDDRTRLVAIHAKLPSKTYLTGTANSDGDIQLDEATGNASANVVQIGGSATPVTNITTVFSTDFAANYDTTLDMWRSNAMAISDDTTAATNLEAAYDGAGYAGGTIKPQVDLVTINASATPVTNINTVFNTDFAANYDTTLDMWRSNAMAISDDTTAATNLESAYDGAGYAGGTVKQQVDVVALSGDTAAADNAEKFFDGTGYGPLVLVTAITEGVNDTSFKISHSGTVADGFKSYTILVSDGVDVVPRVITDSSGTGSVVTLVIDDGVGFTPSPGDIVTILAPSLGDLDRQSLAAIFGKLPSKPYLTGTANSDGDIQLDEATGAAAVNVTQIGGSATPVTNITTVFSTDFAANYDTTLDMWRSNVMAISDDTTAGTNLEAAYDGAGYAGGTVKQQVDLVSIGTDTQSATDLKDFADQGYDPATNKVQGVVLTDTVTTYTSNTPQTGDAFLRLGAPTGASVSVDINDIRNDSRAEVSVPHLIEIPLDGEITYRVELRLYDTNGNMEAPTSAPTIALVNSAGTDRSDRLDSTTMALVETGRYRAIYTSSTADSTEQLNWSFSVIEGGVTRTYGEQSWITIINPTAGDSSSESGGDGFTGFDRAKLEDIFEKLPTKDFLTGTNNDDGDIQLDEVTGELQASNVSAAAARKIGREMGITSLYGTISEVISQSVFNYAAVDPISYEWQGMGEGPVSGLLTLFSGSDGAAHESRYITSFDGNQTRITVNDDFSFNIVNGMAFIITRSPTQLIRIVNKLPSKNYFAGTNNSDGDIQADQMTGNFQGSVDSVVDPVNVGELNGDDEAADNLRDFALDCYDPDADKVTAEVDSLSPALLAQIRDYLLGGQVYRGPFTVDETLVTAGTLTFAGDDSLPSTDSFLSIMKCAVTFTSGELVGMTNVVTSYVGASRTLVFSTPWAVVPAEGDTFVIMGRIG